MSEMGSRERLAEYTTAVMRDMQRYRRALLEMESFLAGAKFHPKSPLRSIAREALRNTEPLPPKPGFYDDGA
jgi:hypothetical protein